MARTRRIPLLLLALLLPVCAPVVQGKPLAERGIFERLFQGAKVVNVVDDFLTFWEAMKDKPVAQQRYWWKRMVEDKYRDYFERAVYRNADVKSRRAMLNEFLVRMPERIEALREFNRQLADPHTSPLIGAFIAFKTRFPDYQQQRDIYIGLSLLRFDGAVRPVQNEAGVPDTLCLGADVLCGYAPDELRLALLHEFFHLYHFGFLFQHPALEEFRAPHMPLMIEGMAVAATEAMLPGHPLAFYLHFSDESQKAQAHDLRANAARFLELVAGNAPPEQYEAWFRNAPAESVPARGGYLLGYEVTRRVLAAMPLEQMVRLAPAELREHAEEQLTEIAGRQVLVLDR
ncbi:MAG TPA: hypothetical protein VJ464_23990 [Blastocatellia bacterium]|nr:hypothetical protein [Blastocatellia bacterium]